MKSTPPLPQNGDQPQAAPISAHVQARILAEALPNMLRYDEKTVVIKFGGHAMAAGLSIDAHRFDEFKEVFEITAQKLLDDATLERKLFHDGPLECEYIEPQTGTLLSDEVWGQGFPAPVFVNQFEVLSQSLVSQKHLKLQLKYVEASDNRDSKVFHGIWFGRSQSLPQTVRLAYRLVTDYYQGVARVQLHIEGADEAL